MAELPSPLTASPKAADKRGGGCCCCAEEGTPPAAQDSPFRRVLELNKRVRERRVDGLDERQQSLLAEVLVNLDDLCLVPDAEVQLDRAEYVITELLSPTPNLLLAERLTQQLIRRVGGRPLRMLRKALLLTLPQVAVVFGLLGSLLIFGPSGYLLASQAEHQLVDQGVVSKLDVAEIIWVGLVGAHGSALSIVVRLRDFNERKGPLMAFFTGLFKPFIGMSFAQLSYALLKSGLLPVKIPLTTWVYIAVGFLAGFSERLAKDLISAGEQVGLRGHPQATGKSNS